MLFRSLAVKMPSTTMTRSVVKSIFLVIVVDGIFAMFYGAVGV